MLAPSYWNQGLATEAAQGLKAWGFEHYSFPRLISTIVPGNSLDPCRAEERHAL